MTEVRMVSETGGEKGQKPAQLGTIDPRALLVLAEVSGFGAQKYAAFNYLRGYDWRLSFDAMLRHMLAFWDGEDRDSESGLPHTAHAAWHGLALTSFLIRDLGTDTRYPTLRDKEAATTEPDEVDKLGGLAPEDEWMRPTLLHLLQGGQDDAQEATSAPSPAYWEVGGTETQPVVVHAPAWRVGRDYLSRVHHLHTVVGDEERCIKNRFADQPCVGGGV